MQLAELLPGLQTVVRNMQSQLAAQQRQVEREGAAARQAACEAAALVETVAAEKKLVGGGSRCGKGCAEPGK